MNELLRNVLTRRSVHKFDPRQIKDHELQEIIEAGKFVSNAIKNQVWHFTVIQNRQVLEEMNTKNNRFLLEYGKDLFKDGTSDDSLQLLCKAPTLIVISGDNANTDTQDAANATFGNMMLAAEKIGIGACWTHSLKLLFDSSEGRALADEIGVPPSYTPLCAGVFGYKLMLSDDVVSPKDGIIHIIR